MLSLNDILDAQAQVESGGNPRARSPVGARGLHQFMPGTWKQYGKGRDIFDREASRDAAKRYLTDLYHKHGDAALALAAYNGGDGAAAYLAKHPELIAHPDYKAPANLWRHQTADYVHKILKMVNPISDANAAEDEHPTGKGFVQSNNDEWEDVPTQQPVQAQQIDNSDEWEDITPEPTAIQPPNESGLAHSAGVSARGLIEGVAGLPASIYNTAQIIPNFIQEKTGINSVIDTPKSIDTEKYGKSIADYIGLPKANDDDRMNEQISKAIGGFVIPGAGMAKLGTAGSKIQAIGKFMGGMNPITTTSGVVGGAAAQELARENDAGDNVQLAANVIGNLAGGGLAGVANMAGRTAGRTGRALVNSSEGVAGRVLNRAAGDQAEQVIRDLESGVVPSINGKMIPGYKPTSSEIAGNAGISSILRQAALDPDTAVSLADRQFSNAKTVKDYAQKAAGTEAYRNAKDAKLWEQVDAVSKPMRQRNLPVDFTPVELEIEKAIQKNAGNPAVIAGLEKLKNNLPNRPFANASGFNEAYNYKQWIDEALRAKNLTDPEIMSLQKAKSAMGDIKKALADSMTATEPEFNDFLKMQAVGVSKLKQRSIADKLINEKASLTTPRVANTATGQEELYPLSASKLKLITRNPKVMNELSQAQQEIFKKAQQHAALEGRDQLGSLVGSNTAQYLNIRDVVAQDILAAITGEGKASTKLGSLAGGLASAITPQGLIKSRTLSSTGVANILAKAKLDPAYAAQLMKTYGLNNKNFNDTATQATLRGLMTGNKKGK